jgi:hypothetical protein
MPLFTMGNAYANVTALGGLESAAPWGKQGMAPKKISAKGLDPIQSTCQRLFGAAGKAGESLCSEREMRSV